MAFWQIFVGVALGLIATIAVVYQQNRNRPKIASSYFASPGETCGICFEAMDNSDMAYLNCGHAFHTNCKNRMNEHQRRACPYCRQ